MAKRRALGLVAHDARKDEMVDWARHHRERLTGFDLYATGTTGSRVAKGADLPVTLLKSGPLGGDLQLGAMIADGTLDALFFFIDPLSAHPHDVDVKALLRISTLKQTALALNRATADLIIASPAFTAPDGA
jgi:methylglyoxal synthase